MVKDRWLGIFGDETPFGIETAGHEPVARSRRPQTVWAGLGRRDVPAASVSGVTQLADLNLQIIEEFRANGGHLGGQFAGRSVVLVHHKGRRSGTDRVNPLASLRVDGGWAVFGSFQGGPRHPDWYFNLLAEPHTTIEVGTETIEVIAREAVGQERDEIFERQKAAVAVFAEYERDAGARVIPVVVFEPAE